MFDNLQFKIVGGFEVPFPRMMRVKQRFNTTKINDIADAIHQQLSEKKIEAKIKPGMKVAITAGSRGIANLQKIILSVVTEIKRLGGIPFIVPAMGSHGGATAEGQAGILAEYGIEERKVGCPIVSSMETVQVGRLPNGLTLYFDKHAFESDAIVVVGRVKPHTDFKGPVESGLQKMIVIGLGKQDGADSMHAYGIDQFHTLIPDAAKILMEKTNISIGVAIIENAHDDTLKIVAMPVEEIADREPGLLRLAKSSMPKLLMDSIDVLVVDEFGKDISGAGMDPNITGRTNSGMVEGFDAPPIQKIVVRDITPSSHGNATGIGMADIITKSFFDKIDFSSLYANTITSTVLSAGKIPIVLENDKQALAVAVKTCNRISYNQAKIVWIKNTLNLDCIYISEAYRDEIQNKENIEFLGSYETIRFDKEGRLSTPFHF